MALPAGYKTVSNNFKVDSNDRLLLSSGTGAKPSGSVGIPGELYADSDGRLLVNGGETILSPSGGDDSVALQALIADGADILLGPGTFLLNTAPISLPKNLNGLRIRGSGKGLTTIKLSASAPRAFDFNRTADYDTFQNILLSDFSVDANNIGGKHHVLIGTQVAGSTQMRLNFSDITVRDVRVYNIVTNVDDSVDCRRGVYLTSQHTNPGETATTLRRIRFQRVRLEGGNQGFHIGGQTSAAGAGSTQFTDELLIEDCIHDTGTILTSKPSGSGSLNFQVGGSGYTGKVRISGCYGRGSGDVGVEVDGPRDTIVENTTIEECAGNPFYTTDFSGLNASWDRRVMYRGCHFRLTDAVWTSVGTSSHVFNCSQQGSIALGRVVVRDCSYYRNTAPASLRTAGEAIFFNAPATSYLVDGFDARIEGLSIPSGAATGSPSLIYEGEGAHGVSTYRKCTLKLAGNIQSGGPNTNFRFYEIGGGSTAVSTRLDLDGLEIESTLTQVNTGQSMYVLMIGNAAATARGTIKGVKVVNFPGPGAGDGVNGIAFGGANLTVPANASITVEECDLTALPQNNEIIFLSGTTNRDKIAYRNNSYRSAASPLSIASAATLVIPDAPMLLVTGTTNITSINALRTGTVVTLQFTGALTFTDGSNLKLDGNFVTTADSTMTLACDGTNYYEISRSTN